MLPRYVRLLKVTHSLSTIYGTNSTKAHCVQIIKTDKTTQINKILDTLAYQLHMSISGINQIQLGNLKPYYEILEAYNESISNKRMLITYCCARALGSISVHRIQLFRQYLEKSLNGKTKISVQLIKDIASHAHIPYKKAFQAFKNSGMTLYDKIKTYPIISTNMTSRQRLNNYIWSLSYMRNKDEHWDARKIGIKYSTMYMAIKQTSAKNISNKFKKLRKYYPSLTLLNIQKILKNNLEPINELIKKVLINIHSRKDLLKFFTIYVKLHNNVLYEDICKKCSHQITDIQSMTQQQLKSWIKTIQHISQMSTSIANSLLQLKCLKMNYRQLPQHMDFKVDYNAILNHPNYQPDNQAKIQNLSNNLKQAKNIMTAWIITKNIIRRLSHIFNFDASKFISQNFHMTKNRVVYIQGYSLLTIHNFQELLRNIYQQFINIQNLRTFKNLTKSKYAHLILIKHKTVANINEAYYPIQQLVDGHRHTFIATFNHTDIKTIPSNNKYYKEYYRPIITLSNIKYKGKIILDNATMNYTKIFINLHTLQHGDVIRFTAMAYPDGMTYNLNRLLSAKLITKVNNHKSFNVPKDIRALIWYSIKENKFETYDFTTWGKNYGYIRFCKEQYKLWKKYQNRKGIQK